MCGPLVNGLEVVKKYKEVPIFTAVDEQQEVENLTVWVFINKETQTFTVAFISNDQNKFCSIASGNEIFLPK